MIPTELLTELKDEYGIIPELTGSQYICDSAPENSDWDYLLEVSSIKSEVASIASFLVGRGFSIDAGEHYQEAIQNTFMSFKKDKLNFLLSNNSDWCTKHRIATKLCKRLKLNNKEDRVATFQAILYGNI